MVNKAQFFLVPPVRWAVDEKYLDKTSINFKAPEALESIKIDPSNLQLLHKKFVWKFGLIMYLLIYKNMPFTFNDACGPAAPIDEHSVKKLVQLIRYRIDSLQWNPSIEQINSPLRKALVYNYNDRITFTQLYKEFSLTFSYYQPKEVTMAKHLSSFGQDITRPVISSNQKSNTMTAGSLKTPFDVDEPERRGLPISHLPKMNTNFKATPFVISLNQDLDEHTPPKSQKPVLRSQMPKIILPIQQQKKNLLAVPDKPLHSTVAFILQG